MLRESLVFVRLFVCAVCFFVCAVCFFVYAECFYRIFTVYLFICFLWAYAGLILRRYPGYSIHSRCVFPTRPPIWRSVAGLRGTGGIHSANLRSVKV